MASAQRQVRFLVTLVLVIPACVTGYLVLRIDGVAAQPQVAAKARSVLKAPFDVVGADGNRLITVEEKNGGGAEVRFYRAENKINAIVDCTPAGGSFALVMPDQKLGVVLDSLTDGGSVSVFNANGKEGLLVRATSNQGTKLTLVDKDGTVLLTKP